MDPVLRRLPVRPGDQVEQRFAQSALESGQHASMVRRARLKPE
jgi:hypothetical protein